jgi:hypothetical protein
MLHSAVLSHSTTQSICSSSCIFRMRNVDDRVNEIDAFELAGILNTYNLGPLGPCLSSHPPRELEAGLVVAIVFTIQDMNNGNVS